MRLEYWRFLSGLNRYSHHSVVVGKIDPATIGQADITSLCDRIDLQFAVISEVRLDKSAVADVPHLVSLVAANLASLIEPVGQALAFSSEEFGTFGATCHDYRVGPRLRLAFDLVNACMARTASSDTHDEGMAEELQKFQKFLTVQTLGVDSRAIINAARRKGIPWHRVRFGQSFGAFQLGWGKSSQRYNGTRTKNSSHVACKLSHDKVVTAAALKSFGLPVPQQRIVNSLSEAQRSAQIIGFPVVVKPLKGNMGKGVSAAITNEMDLKAAVQSAQRHGRRVIVESMLPGDDHRFLVANGKVLAVSKKLPAMVVGDGATTITELIEKMNAETSRSSNGRHSLTAKIVVDDDLRRTLKDSGRSLEFVPRIGDEVRVKSVSNRHAGGSTADVTAIVHDDNIKTAIAAAGVLGLDIAGVDFLLPDAARSWRETGGGICEVNDQPGLAGHAISSDRDFGEIILREIFPVDSDGRIPVVALWGFTAGQAQFLVQELSRSGLSITQSNVNLLESLSEDNWADRYVSLASATLHDPNSEVAILPVPENALSMTGLVWDRATVLAILGRNAGDPGLAQIKQAAERVVEAVSIEEAIREIGDRLHNPPSPQ